MYGGVGGVEPRGSPLSRFGVPSMFNSLRVTVLFRQPDEGEALAKRRGVFASWGLKEAWSKGASRWTRTGYEAYGAGRVG